MVTKFEPGKFYTAIGKYAFEGKTKQVKYQGEIETSRGKRHSFEFNQHVKLLTTSSSDKIGEYV